MANATEATPSARPPSVWKPLLLGGSVVALIYIGFTYCLLYAPVALQDPKSDVIKTGQFGDSFGALNALFTGLAFVALIVTLLLQRRDLQASLEELHHSVDAQTKNANAAEQLMKAQLLRDRLEMYWRTYEPVKTEQIEELKLYPEEYMTRTLFDAKYKGHDEKIRKYIYMSVIYEHLAFTFFIRELQLPDFLGPQWVKLYCTRLVRDEQFCDVHAMYRGYYPLFESYLDALLPK